jgi:hypothetical protein
MHQEMDAGTYIEATRSKSPTAAAFGEADEEFASRASVGKAGRIREDAQIPVSRRNRTEGAQECNDSSSEEGDSDSNSNSDSDEEQYPDIAQPLHGMNRFGSRGVWGGMESHDEEGRRRSKQNEKKEASNRTLYAIVVMAVIGVFGLLAMSLIPSNENGTVEKPVSVQSTTAKSSLVRDRTPVKSSAKEDDLRAKVSALEEEMEELHKKLVETQANVVAPLGAVPQFFRMERKKGEDGELQPEAPQPLDLQNILKTIIEKKIFGKVEKVNAECSAWKAKAHNASTARLAPLISEAEELMDQRLKPFVTVVEAEKNGVEQLVTILQSVHRDVLALIQDDVDALRESHKKLQEAKQPSGTWENLTTVFGYGVSTSPKQLIGHDIALQEQRVKEGLAKLYKELNLPQLLNTLIHAVNKPNASALLQAEHEKFLARGKMELLLNQDGFATLILSEAQIAELRTTMTEKIDAVALSARKLSEKERKEADQKALDEVEKAMRDEVDKAKQSETHFRAFRRRVTTVFTKHLPAAGSWVGQQKITQKAIDLAGLYITWIILNTANLDSTWSWLMFLSMGRGMRVNFANSMISLVRNTPVVLNDLLRNCQQGQCLKTLHNPVLWNRFNFQSLLMSLLFSGRSEYSNFQRFFAGNSLPANPGELSQAVQEAQNVYQNMFQDVQQKQDQSQFHSIVKVIEEGGNKNGVLDTQAEYDAFAGFLKTIQENSKP